MTNNTAIAELKKCQGLVADKLHAIGDKMKSANSVLKFFLNYRFVKLRNYWCFVTILIRELSDNKPEIHPVDRETFILACKKMAEQLLSENDEKTKETTESKTSE